MVQVEALMAASRASSTRMAGRRPDVMTSLLAPMDELRVIAEVEGKVTALLERIKS